MNELELGAGAAIGGGIIDEGAAGASVDGGMLEGNDPGIDVWGTGFGAKGDLWCITKEKFGPVPG